MRFNLHLLVIFVLTFALTACNQSSPLSGAEPELTTASLPTVTSFILIDADSGRHLATLKDGSSVSLAKYGKRRLNIQAKTSGADSVRFSVNGKTVRTDKSAPFTLAAKAWMPTTGNHRLKATPYSSGISTQGNNSRYPLVAGIIVTK